jgi:hypothetical protein
MPRRGILSATPWLGMRRATSGSARRRTASTKDSRLRAKTYRAAFDLIKEARHCYDEARVRTASGSRFNDEECRRGCVCWGVGAQLVAETSGEADSEAAAEPALRRWR